MQLSYKSKGVIVLIEVDECTVVHHMKEQVFLIIPVNDISATVNFTFKKDELETQVWVDNVCQGESHQPYQLIGDELVDGKGV
jgi:hypothetical protein